jgi:hypothetical protein
MRIAQSSQVGGDDHGVVVHAGAGPVLGQHGELRDRGQGGRPAAGDHGDGDASLLEEGERLLEEDAGVGIAVREGHEALELQARELHGDAGEVEGRLRRLDTVAPEAGVALDQEAHGHAVTGAGLGQPARHDVVVQDHGEPPDPLRHRHQPVQLGRPEHVVGQEHVVGHAGVGEHLRLTDLLHRDPDGAGRHLHPADRWDLVRLDVRAVRQAVAVEVRLYAPDVRLHDVEVDGDRRRVEVTDVTHDVSSAPSGRRPSAPRHAATARRFLAAQRTSRRESVAEPGRREHLGRQGLREARHDHHPRSIRPRGSVSSICRPP